MTIHIPLPMWAIIAIVWVIGIIICGALDEAVGMGAGMMGMFYAAGWTTFVLIGSLIYMAVT